MEFFKRVWKVLWHLVDWSVVKTLLTTAAAMITPVVAQRTGIFGGWATWEVVVALLCGVVVVGCATWMLAGIAEAATHRIIALLEPPKAEQPDGTESFSELARAAWNGRSSAIETLLTDDLANMRNALAEAEHNLRESRREVDNARNNLNLQAEQAQKHAQARAEAESAAKNDKAEALAAMGLAQQRTAQMEAMEPLHRWAEALVAEARDRLAQQIAIVDYRFRMNDLDEDVAANFGFEVLLRYSGVIPAVVGESLGEYGDKLRFHNRQMTHAAEVGTVLLYRGQSQWLWVRQIVGYDGDAVRADWKAGGITVDASRLRVSIRCEAPDGGEPITGWLALEEMQWPKIVK